MIKIINKATDEDDLINSLSKYDLKRGILNLKSKKLSMPHLFILLSHISPKVGVSALKYLLDSTKEFPIAKDEYKCSPMMFSKILDDVKLTSLLFDYIVYHKKWKVEDSAKVWWIKMNKMPDFKFKVKWSLKHKYLPFYGSEKDTVTIEKRGHRILIHMNKLKGSGLNFKTRETTFMFESILSRFMEANYFRQKEEKKRKRRVRKVSRSFERVLSRHKEPEESQESEDEEEEEEKQKQEFFDPQQGSEGSSEECKFIEVDSCDSV